MRQRSPSPVAVTNRKLNLVSRADELSGQVSADLERAVRTAQPASELHRGLSRGFLALCQRALRASVPPSALPTAQNALRVVEQWTNEQATTDECVKARAQLFAAIGAIEATTTTAFSKAGASKVTAPSPTGEHQSTWQLLLEHARAVSLRYVSLSAHLALTGTCALLDSIELPEASLPILSDLAAARAYQLCAVSSLRHPPFIEQAFRQALWDAARPESRRMNLTPATLAPQILHEYLGARFRASAHIEHAELEAFLRWACP